MTPENELRHLISLGDCEALLAFLSNKTEKERLSYGAEVSRISAEYSALDFDRNISDVRVTKEQSLALDCAKMVCYNKTSILNDEPDWMLSRELLDKILAFYVPSWFNDYINLFASRAWLPMYLKYDFLVELSRKGLLQPEPELLAKTLANYPFKWEEHNSILLLERLYLFEETLLEHIWYLFEFDTTMNYGHLRTEGGSDEERMKYSWISIFKGLADKQEIDRKRLLREAIRASNRNFDKNLSGFFADMFAVLHPSAEEIIDLQFQLFGLFSSPHSKVVRNALLACKQAVDEPLFNSEHFFDSIAPVLVSDIKSNVVLGLQLIEKAAKTRADVREKIPTTVAPALIIKDADVQTRVARLITRYGIHNPEEVKALISPYVPAIYSSAREIFKGVLNDEYEAAAKPGDPISQGSAAPLLLPQIDSMDDVVFLCSQAFDNKESWHIDLLPSTLLRWNDRIKGDVIKRLLPSFQKALKLWPGGLRSGLGDLDRLLAAFFIDYGLVLMKKYPADTEGLRALYEELFRKHEALNKQWKEYDTSLSFIDGWRAGQKTDLYCVYATLMLEVLMHIRTGVSLPVLSTPTHVPCWIDPVELVKRIVIYQEKKLSIGSMDLQIAISRCMLHDANAALQLAQKKLNREIKDLFVFLFSNDTAISNPLPPFTPHWKVAALAKRIPEYLVAPDWKVGLVPFEEETYEYKDNQLRRIKQTVEYKVLRVHMPGSETTERKSAITRWISSVFIKSHDLNEAVSIYDWPVGDSSYFVIAPNDMCRLMMLIPNNPEPLLAEVINDAFAYSEFSESVHRQMATESVKALYSIWTRMGETGHLFFACCLLAADATIVAYAAELWLKAVQERSADNARLGYIVGRLHQMEYAPIRRFTDVALDRFLNTSPDHNSELQVLLVELLKQIPDSGIRNLKKALEIYKELLRVNGSQNQDKLLIEKLNLWKQSPGLRKLIEGL